MLTEIRKLIFPTEDLIKAVEIHNKKGPKSLPAGDITGATLNGDGTPGASVQIGGESVALDEEFLVAALVRYCIDSTIPVPKQAVKNLELVDGKLALKIHISEAVATGRDYYVLL